MNSFKRWLATLTVCLTAFGTSTAMASDWPQWRGPDRNGISRETGLLKEWPTEGPKLVWQVKEIGYGFSTPSIVGDRIYLLSNKGNDEEFVQALSVKDGKQIWSMRIGKVGANQGPQYPGARSTPTLSGDALYALGSDGDLVCLEAATGKLRWQKNVRTDFGGKPGMWAYSESPLVDGDNLVCTPGGPAATLVALNKKTGDVVWKSAVPGEDVAGYASIAVTDIGGVKQYVQFVSKGVVGVDAKTGKFLWRYDGTAKNSPANIPTPVIYNGEVYTSSGLVGGGLARIKAANGAYETEQVYFDKKLPKAIGGTVRIGDFLYGTGSTTLQCVEFATGAVKWEDRCVGPGSICYADGMLYVHGENGSLALVEATADGYHEKGRFAPSDQPERARTQAWAYPVIANGKLYIRDLGSLWCYDIKGGK